MSTIRCSISEAARGAAVVALSALAVVACETRTGPPATATVEAADTTGDIVVPDPYRWLEDGSSEAVAEWIAAQNEWSDAAIAALPERQPILRRIVELLRADAVTEPVVRGDRYFFARRSPDEQSFAIFVRNGPDGVDRRLIDPHRLSDSAPPILSILSVTPDGGVVTYSVRAAGADEAEIRFHDVDRGVDLAVRLPPGRYTGAEMLADRSGIYYTRLENDGPRLRYRSMATPVTADTIVFGRELGPDRVIGAAVSEDGRWLGIVVFGGAAGQVNDVWVSDLRADGVARPVVQGIQASFLPTFAGDVLLLQTDWNAPNGRILRVPLADPRRERWVEIVPERADAIIEGLAAVNGRVLVNTLRDAYSHIDAYDIDGAHIASLDLPYPGTVTAMAGGWSRREAFFGYSTYHVPPTIERYDAVTGEVASWFEPRVPIPSDITVRVHDVRSGDGTRVPLFVVHRSGIRLDGHNPALLTGFGGFGASLSPGFLAEAVITAERGGVFVVAIVRGGGELGDAWHEAGMLERKPRAIDDFLAVAEWLIAERYTNPEQLAAIGATHGGMLVTAAMTRRPELFGVLAARFPVLDMARFDRTAAGAGWVAEYGSPSDPATLGALLEFSPYHAVDLSTTYPPALLVAGASSPADPFHARKMTARLQAAQGGPFLLREDTVRPSPTGGAANAIETLADIMAFVLENTARESGPRPRS